MITLIQQPTFEVSAGACAAASGRLLAHSPRPRENGGVCWRPRCDLRATAGACAAAQIKWRCLQASALRPQGDCWRLRCGPHRRTDELNQSSSRAPRGAPDALPAILVNYDFDTAQVFLLSSFLEVLRRSGRTQPRKKGGLRGRLGRKKRDKSAEGRCGSKNNSCSRRRIGADSYACFSFLYACFLLPSSFPFPPETS